MTSTVPQSAWPESEKSSGGVRCSVQEVIERKGLGAEGLSLSQIAAREGISFRRADDAELVRLASGGSPAGASIPAGAIHRLPSGSYEIVIRRDDNYCRQRFTFAHELGHYFLHREKLEGSGIVDFYAPDGSSPGRSVVMRRHRTSDAPEELEANEFAAELLMPEAKVRSLWEYTHHLSVLADMFSVSRSAMAMRLHKLSIA